MAVTVQTYNQLTELLGDSTIDLDGHTFKIALMTSSHVFDANNTLFTSVTSNQIANGTGYTTNGATLGSVTWGQTGGVATFDFADPEWTASGGAIGPAGYAVIYDDTAAGDPLMFSINFGTSVTAVDGARLVIRVSSAGLFTIS